MRIPTSLFLWRRRALGSALGLLLLGAAGLLPACSSDKQENPAPVGTTTASGTEDISILGLRPRYVIPDTLQAPAGTVLLASLFATGVQIYEVRARAANPNQFEWAFVAPEATLYGADQFVVGQHYAGPTWESNDGSTVVGRLVASQPAPASAFSIPWLLLTSRLNTGDGVFSRVAYVQRLNTRGGQAPPAQTATRATLGRRARIPYTSTYLFYASK